MFFFSENEPRQEVGKSVSLVTTCQRPSSPSQSGLPVRVSGSLPARRNTFTTNLPHFSSKCSSEYRRDVPERASYVGWKLLQRKTEKYNVLGNPTERNPESPKLSEGTQISGEDNGLIAISFQMLIAFFCYAFRKLV